jgi:hypothetical protein
MTKPTTLSVLVPLIALIALFALALPAPASSALPPGKPYWVTTDELEELLEMSDAGISLGHCVGWGRARWLDDEYGSRARHFILFRCRILWADGDLDLWELRTITKPRGQWGLKSRRIR